MYSNIPTYSWKITIYFYADCTLSPREPETRRKRECRLEHSPRLGSSRVASALMSRLIKFSLFLASVMHESKGLVSRLAVASCRAPKLRVLSKSVESHSLSLVSGNSRLRLAKCTRRECTAGIIKKDSYFLKITLSKSLSSATLTQMFGEIISNSF